MTSGPHQTRGIFGGHRESLSTGMTLPRNVAIPSLGVNEIAVNPTEQGSLVQIPNSNNVGNATGDDGQAVLRPPAFTRRTTQRFWCSEPSRRLTASRPGKYVAAASSAAGRSEAS